MVDFAIMANDWAEYTDAEFKASQMSTTFEPGTMANGTTCYWRIDEENAAGTVTGTIWSFTTRH